MASEREWRLGPRRALGGSWLHPAVLSWWAGLLPLEPGGGQSRLCRNSVVVYVSLSETKFRIWVPSWWGTGAPLSDFGGCKPDEMSYVWGEAGFY